MPGEGGGGQELADRFLESIGAFLEINRERLIAHVQVGLLMLSLYL